MYIVCMYVMYIGFYIYIFIYYIYIYKSVF